jgi:hypothetical protein
MSGSAHHARRIDLFAMSGCSRANMDLRHDPAGRVSTPRAHSSDQPAIDAAEGHLDRSAGMTARVRPRHRSDADHRGRRDRPILLAIQGFSAPEWASSSDSRRFLLPEFKQRFPGFTGK